MRHLEIEAIWGQKAWGFCCFDTCVPGINALSRLSITYIVEPFVFRPAFVGASSEIGIDWASFFLGVRFLAETLRS